MPDESNFTESERLLAQLASELRQRAEAAEAESDRLRKALGAAHDSAEKMARALVDAVRR